MIKKAKLLVLAVAFFWFLPLSAVSGSEQKTQVASNKFLEMPLSELMEVVVATPTKTQHKASETPANIIVVTKKQIHERGYVNLADLLEDMPNVDVNRNTTGTQTQIGIRGISGSNNFIIMQDGVRISSPTGEIIPVQDNFPLFHAKQVELVFGPASALYGADAFSGIINIITEDAGKIDGAEISAAIGSDDYFYNYLNSGKKVAEKLEIVVGGHWNKSQNPDLSESYPGAFAKTDILTTGNKVFRAASDREPYVAPTESHSAYLKMDYDKKFTAGLTRSYFSHPSTSGLKPSQTLYSKDSELDTLIETYYGKYKHDFNARFSSEASLNYSMYQLLPESKFTNLAPDFSSFKYAKGEKLQFEQQLNYRISEKQGIIGGFVYENFESIPRTSDLPKEYNTDLDSDNQNLVFPNTTLPIKIYDVNYNNYATYLQAESKWTPAIASVIGVRFDHNTRYGDSTNPRAGLILKPASATVLKILYGESYLAPAAERAFRFFGSFSGAKNAKGEFISSGLFNLPNPDLKPEKMRTLEFNLTRNVSENFIAGASGFYTTITDSNSLVFKNETSNFIEGASIGRFARFENAGDRVMFGGDLRADYQMFLENFVLKFWGNYSWVDGYEDLVDGGTGPLGLIARNKIKGGVTARYADQYFITPRFEWIDKTAHFASNRPDKVSSYAVMHLHAGADNFYGSWSAFVDVRNLLDNSYFNAAALGQSFGSTPQDPRRIFFGLKYKF